MNLLEILAMTGVSLVCLLLGFFFGRLGQLSEPDSDKPTDPPLQARLLRLFTHEMHNRIGPIQVYSNLLQKQSLGLNDSAQRHVKKLGRAAHFITNAVMHLEGFVTQRETDPSHEKVQLGELWSDILTDMESTTSESINLAIVGEIPIDAMTSGSEPTLRLTLRVLFDYALLHEPGHLHIKLGDEGSGWRFVFTWETSSFTQSTDEFAPLRSQSYVDFLRALTEELAKRQPGLHLALEPGHLEFVAQRL